MLSSVLYKFCNNLTISVSSEDIDLEFYGEQHTFSLACDDATLVSTSCVSTRDRTADCTFDVLDHQYGSAACTVTVSDGNGSSDSEDITFTVNSVNDPVTLHDVGDQSTDKVNQNELFEQLDDEILDFSESNPFGDAGEPS